MRFVPLSLSLIALWACAGRAPAHVPGPQPAQPPAADAPPAKPGRPVDNVSLADVGLDGDMLDRNADPCEDFYRFACGGWIDKAEIPSDLPAWSRASELKRHNDEVLKQALEEAARGETPDPGMAKLGAYQRACMNEAAIEKIGIKPLAPLLKTVAKVRDVPSLATAIAELHKNRIFVVFELLSEQDYKKSTEMIARVQQSGLGMPDREYYLRQDEDGKKTRAAYQAHVQRMLRLLGQSAGQATAGAAQVLSVETKLAQAQRSRSELRDVKATYNRLDRGGLARTAPALGWDAYFSTVGRSDISAINVESPAYIEKLATLLTSVPPAAWRSYLAYHLGIELAPYLPKRFLEEKLALDRVTRGSREQPERWRRCITLADDDMGELVSQPFVKKTLSEDSRAAGEAMIKEVAAALGRSLTGEAWMDAATQAKAAAKLAKLDSQVGYPKTWRSYDFTVDEKSFAGTHLAAARFEQAWRLSKIGKPVDRGEFKHHPHEVNAYYDASLNQMVLLAGIMQPPFYNPKASVTVNLGSMGMVVGHELTHGFDDEGALFDGDGNLSDWWPGDVSERFRERTQCVAKAYSQLEVLPGLNLNGQLTNGENIADIGGVRMAFRAYRTVRKNAERVQVADGFTEDQQFFLATAQAWCSKETEPYLRLAATTDRHSIKRYRINGSFSNLREFAGAFECKAGAKLRPENVCEVW